MARRSRLAFAVLAVVVAGGVALVPSYPTLGTDDVTRGNEWRQEYHYQFRSAFDFLSDDPDHIEQLMKGDAANPEALAVLNLEISDSEWAELQRRQRLLDLVVPIKREVTGLPLDASEEATETPGGRSLASGLFSGIWLDNLDGGRLKLAVTNRSLVDLDAIHRVLPRGSEDIVVIEQVYSRGQFELWQQAIVALIEERGYQIAVGYDYSDSGVRLRIIPLTEEAKADVADVVSDLPPDAFVVDAPTHYVLAGPPGSNHSAADQQSGLRIGIYDSGGQLITDPGMYMGRDRPH